MKVFISQPMADRMPEEIEAERAEIMQMVAKEYSDENPVEIASYFGPNNNFKPLECLGLAIQMMERADLVVFASDWMKERGCKIEHECAEKYGKEIMHTIHVGNDIFKLV